MISFNSFKETNQPPKKTYPKPFTDLELLCDSIRNTLHFTSAFSSMKDTIFDVVLRNRTCKCSSVPDEMFNRHRSVNLRFVYDGCFVGDFLDWNCRTNALPVDRWKVEC